MASEKCAHHAQTEPPYMIHTYICTYVRLYVHTYMVRKGTDWKASYLLGILNHLNPFFVLCIFRGKTKKTHLEDHKKYWKEMPELLSNRNDRKQRHTNTHKKVLAVCVSVCTCDDVKCSPAAAIQIRIS